MRIDKVTKGYKVGAKQNMDYVMQNHGKYNVNLAD